MAQRLAWGAPLFECLLVALLLLALNHRECAGESPVTDEVALTYAVVLAERAHNEFRASEEDPHRPVRTLCAAGRAGCTGTIELPTDIDATVSKKHHLDG